jgi:hypothetical protein
MKKFVAVMVLMLSACIAEPLPSATTDQPLSCFGLQPMCGPGMYAVCICGPIGSGGCHWECTR